MSTPMMKCGHAANATCGGKPVCAICAGTGIPGGRDIDESPPEMAGRMAKCSYRSCKTKPVPSSPELAFFAFKGANSFHATQTCKCGYFEEAHRPGTALKCKAFTPAGPAEFDEYYCGCFGWD